MMLTGDNRSTGRYNCPSATFFTTNVTCNGLGSNPGLCGEKPVTDLLSNDVAILRHEN